MKFHNYHLTTSEASKTSSTKKKRKWTAEWTWNTFRVIVVILIFVNARMSDPTALFVSFEQISYAFSSIAPTFAQFFGSRQYSFDIDAPEMTFIGRNSIFYECHSNAEFPIETFPFIYNMKKCKCQTPVLVFTLSSSVDNEFFYCLFQHSNRTKRSSWF